ncbi:hypothetical protein Q5752_005260 [Cryptotrichosporon argae]
MGRPTMRERDRRSLASLKRLHAAVLQLDPLLAEESFHKLIARLDSLAHRDRTDPGVVSVRKAWHDLDDDIRISASQGPLDASSGFQFASRGAVPLAPVYQGDSQRPSPQLWRGGRIPVRDPARLGQVPANPPPRHHDDQPYSAARDPSAFYVQGPIPFGAWYPTPLSRLGRERNSEHDTDDINNDDEDDNDDNDNEHDEHDEHQDEDQSDDNDDGDSARSQPLPMAQRNALSDGSPISPVNLPEILAAAMAGAVDQPERPLSPGSAWVGGYQDQRGTIRRRNDDDDDDDGNDGSVGALHLARIEALAAEIRAEADRASVQRRRLERASERGPSPDAPGGAGVAWARTRSGSSSPRSLSHRAARAAPSRADVHAVLLAFGEEADLMSRHVQEIITSVSVSHARQRRARPDWHVAVAYSISRCLAAAADVLGRMRALAPAVADIAAHPATAAFHAHDVSAASHQVKMSFTCDDADVSGMLAHDSTFMDALRPFCIAFKDVAERVELVADPGLALWPNVADYVALIRTAHAGRAALAAYFPGLLGRLVN